MKENVICDKCGEVMNVSNYDAKNDIYTFTCEKCGYTKAFHDVK